MEPLSSIIKKTSHVIFRSSCELSPGLICKASQHSRQQLDTRLEKTPGVKHPNQLSSGETILVGDASMNHHTFFDDTGGETILILNDG